MYVLDVCRCNGGGESCGRVFYHSPFSHFSFTLSPLHNRTKKVGRSVLVPFPYSSSERHGCCRSMSSELKASAMVAAAFEATHGFVPRPWQLKDAALLLKRCCRRSSSKPQPIMLVRTTSGGKSAVRDVVGYCVGGVILTIVPLLSLAADQVKKMA